VDALETLREIEVREGFLIRNEALMGEDGWTIGISRTHGVS